jgi:hypothetical protein
VVSINANRGITAGAGIVGDGGLNLARGRLILRHLELLKSWHDNPGTTPASLGIDLFGKLDFTNVGLMGHSRGGEGVRAAYNLYHDPGSIWLPRIPGLVVKGIFEIGAVDGQTSRVLNADGTKWNQLLPACDGDVSNLQGVRPYDRMLTSAQMENPPTQKSYFMVWGANHNFYNTEWQVSDSFGCFNHTPLFSNFVGSASQRLTAIVPLVAFFRANVGMNPPADPDPVFNQIFNPWYRLPQVITSVTRVDREFVHAPDSPITLAFEYFDQPTGTNTYGPPNETSNLFTYTHTTNPARHDPSRRMAAISWRDPGSNVYFQTNWTAVGSGMDVRGYKALDFSIALRTLPEAPLDFSLRLVHDDGTMSSRVNFASYHQNLLNTIAGGPGGLHTLLFTTRIPLKGFINAQLRHVRGIRFTFDDTARVDIFLGNIRLSTKLKTPDGVNDPLSPSIDTEDVAEASAEEESSGHPMDGANTVPPGPVVHSATPVRYEAANAHSNGGNSNNNLTEGVVTYSSSNVFAPRAELFQLMANGDPISKLSANSNDLHELRFTVSAADYQKLLAASDIRISCGNESWIIRP